VRPDVGQNLLEAIAFGMSRCEGLSPAGND
jgi:hypothetical protein